MSFASCLKRIEALEYSAQFKTQQHIFFDIEKRTIEVRDSERVIRRYSPDDAPTILAYHKDISSRHKLIMGPRGSSKSSGSIAEIFFKTFLNPPCVDGVKRARWLVGRETYGELQTTTIRTFEHWFGHDCLNYKIRRQPPIEARFEYFDGECKTELEIIFVSFDNEKAAKKALSLEVTGAYFNEAKMIAIAPIDEIDGSLGRYPALDDRIPERLNEYWTGIIYDTNSFEEYHPFYRRFVTHPDKGFKFFKQPGGMNEVSGGVFKENLSAENIHHLVEGYYRNMALGKSHQFIRTQICNQFGVYEEGKPVHAEYDPKLHSVDTIEVDNNYPIYLGHDYGGTNATLVAQYIDGQLRVIKELIGFKQGLRDFMQGTVKDWLRLNATGCTVKSSVGDPADNYAHITAEYSNATVTDALGIKTDSAVTNNVKARIDAVDKFILKRVGGAEVGLLVSRSGCPTLHAGLSGKYKLKIVKSGGSERLVEKPDKDGVYDHPNDCLQYIALEIAEREMSEATYESAINSNPISRGRY